MRRNTILRTIAVVVVLALGTRIGRAQESSSKSEAGPKMPTAYHLDFSLNELEEGKRINTRQYSVNLLATPAVGPRLSIGYGRSLKIGTRVPIETDQGKTEYLDIGTRISCTLVTDEAGQLALEASAELSSLVPKSEKDQYVPASRNPMVRQLSIQASTTIIPGKLTSLGTVDDPDSKRQFQLEVTVTKLR